jgi:hypothetical protein
LDSLSDVEKIFVVIAILYAIETLLWLRSGSDAFISIAGRFLYSGRCVTLLANDRGRLALGAPLPFDASFVAQGIPVSIGEEGVVGFLSCSPAEDNRSVSTEHFFDWQQLLQVKAEENQVRVGSDVLCTVRNYRDANLLANRLRHLAAVTDEVRPMKILDWTRIELDTQAIGDRVRAWHLQTKTLRLASTLLFLWIFVIGLVSYWGYVPGASDPLFLVAYLAMSFCLWWFIVWRVYWAHRFLYRENRLGRAKSVLMSLISPGVAMRAGDHVSRDLFQFVHPLALAFSILPVQAATERAKQVWRDLEYPAYPIIPEGMSKPAFAAVTAHRIRTQRYVENLIESCGVELGSITAPPTRSDESSVAYCLRCHSEFTRTDATCSRCGERPVVPFDMI